MAKSKKKKNKKSRKKEALKAQSKTNTRRSKPKKITQVEENKKADIATETKSKTVKAHTLPLKSIKKDLKKTVVFAIVSIGVLFTLSITNTTHTDILEFFKGL